MDNKLLHTDGDLRTYVLIFRTGDEVVSTLTDFAAEHQITAAHFTAIGAFSDATVRFFDWQSREYEPISIDEQVEVLMCAGDVALKEDGKPKVHTHVVLGRRDATAYGGDLKEAHVRPTLELILTESPVHLRRRHDPASGLALIDLNASN